MLLREGGRFLEDRHACRDGELRLLRLTDTDSCERRCPAPPTDHAVLPPLTPNTCRAANATVVGTTGVMWTGHDALFVPGPAGAVGLVPSGLCGVRVGRGELACGGRCSPPTHHMQAEAAVVDRASWFEHPIEPSFNSQTGVGLGPRLIERALINRKIVDPTPPWVNGA
jgi:hypothetical protein